MERWCITGDTDRCVPSPVYHYVFLCGSISHLHLPVCGWQAFFFFPKLMRKMLTSPNLWLTCVTVHLMYLASTRLVNIKFSTQFRLHTLKASSARWIELQRWNEKPRNYPLNRGFTRAGIHPGGKKSEDDLHCRRPASFFFPFTVMSQSTVTFREGQWKRHPFKAEWAEHPLVLSSSDKVGSWSNTLVRWFGLMGC